MNKTTVNLVAAIGEIRAALGVGWGLPTADLPALVKKLKAEANVANSFKHLVEDANDENTRLQAEIVILKAENERLKAQLLMCGGLIIGQDPAI
jgi:hypothetical protein